MILPLARPAIFAGVALVAMETMAEFGAVDYCAVDTFATGIYRTWMGRQDLIAAAQLSTCLLGAVGLLYVLESWSRRSAKFHHATQRTQRVAPVTLTGTWRWMALVACAVPVTVGFLLPVSRFLQLTLAGGDSRAGELFAEIVDQEVNAAVLADDAGERFAGDRLGGGEDHRLDAQHPLLDLRHDVGESALGRLGRERA
mgnify:CR=1 FL=1